MNKKIFLLSLILFLTLNFSFVSACSLNDLGSCSFNDLKDFISNLLSKKKVSCSNVYLPVCSESSKTFANECFLKEEKQTLAHLGTCLEYPYNLSATFCVKEKFEWDGYKCLKDNNFVSYNNEELGFSLLLPSNSKIEEKYIEIPKERNNTNLFYKKLEINSGKSCSDISYYAKIKEEKEVNIKGNVFKLIIGTNDLSFENDLKTKIDYRNYILKKDDSCISFLFSMYSLDDFSLRYDENIEASKFEQILESYSTTVKKEIKKSPCNDLGDLNEDGFISEDDLNYFDFGAVENNLQKRGDLNGDDKVENEDKNILNSFLLGKINSFEACLLSSVIKTGFAPKISSKDFSIVQDKGKTEVKLSLNLDISADMGDVYLKSDLSFLNILNEEGIKVEDATFSTGAVIREDGYLFLEKGKTTWLFIELKLKAKEKPVYSKVFIDGIDYLNEKGEIEKLSLLVQSSRFYLNYIKNNLICDSYGDINNDSIIDEKDILYITEEKELTEEEFKRADVSGNGEVNLIDAIEIKRYLQEKKSFSICDKNYTPKIYENPSISVTLNKDKTKHVVITFYLDSSEGEAMIKSSVSTNQDDLSSGIYLKIERDGNVSLDNLKLLSSGEPTNKGFIKIKKNTPSWIKLEFDARAINDTALVNFIVNKIIYLSEGEEKELNLSGIKTGDIFLNYGNEKLISPCEKLGDLDEDGFVSFSDYEYLEENMNLLLIKKEKFVFADLNKDGIINDLDKEEMDQYLNKKTSSFSGCLKEICSEKIEPVYTEDGFIYANECYLQTKEIKCFIGKDCGI